MMKFTSVLYSHKKLLCCSVPQKFFSPTLRAYLSASKYWQLIFCFFLVYVNQINNLVKRQINVLHIARRYFFWSVFAALTKRVDNTLSTFAIPCVCSHCCKDIIRIWFQVTIYFFIVMWLPHDVFLTNHMLDVWGTSYLEKCNAWHIWGHMVQKNHGNLTKRWKVDLLWA